MQVWKGLSALVMAAAVLGAPGQHSVLAQEDRMVTLRSFDGFTQLRGTLLGFENGTYTIETVLGVIQVDGLQVDCEGAVCPTDVLFGAKFGIHGSNTIGAELMPALLEGYADTLGADLVLEVGQGPEERMARIVHRGRTRDGRDRPAGQGLVQRVPRNWWQGSRDRHVIAADARQGSALAGPCRGSGELRDTKDEHIVALDGLIAIVHESNPISAVSLEELALIFSGAVSNWSQLGGRDAPINLYARDEVSGTFQTFGSLVLAPYGSEISPAAKRFVSNINLSDSVAGDPNGIGVTAAAYERAARALPISQECGLLSYPTTFAMKAEEYPLFPAASTSTRPRMP